MSLPYETMLDLMRYADGDDALDADARARVEALLRTNEEARRVVDAMGTLGEVVREGIDQRVGKSGVADGIADGVMAAIAREAQRAEVKDGASASRSARVVELASGRARRSRAGVTSAVVAVLALAAGVAFLVTSKAPAPQAKDEPIAPSSSPVERAGSSRASESPSASAETLAESEGHGVDLEEVRSIRNKVNVFFTPTTPAAGASVVVWIDDRPGGH
jgi:hypothetical protein